MTPLKKPVRRRCLEALPHQWGKDRGRRLVLELAPPDLIGFRVERSRRIVYIPASACYRYALELEARRRRLEAAAKRGNRVARRR